MSPVTTAFEPKPEPGQEHLHLLGRGVLRLVEDDERVVERAAAHERDRRDLDRAALDQTRGALGVHHVVERVVERAQIRIHLLLQVAGQEAELLARLDGRPRQDDAADLLGQQVADRLRHRQIGLARAGRADAEDDVVLLDRLEVAPLVGALRVDATARAFGLLLPVLQEVVAEVDAAVVGHELGRGLHVAVAQLVALGHQARQLLEDALDALLRLLVALDDELVALRADRDAEQRLDVLEVAVVGAVERLDAFLRQGDLLHDLRICRCSSRSCF